VEALNPGTDLDSLSHQEIIKLPVDKYSAHEQYQLLGTLGTPAVFRPGSIIMNSLLIGAPPPPLALKFRVRMRST
jgi:hypothetical protein